MIDVLTEELCDLKQAAKHPAFRNSKTGKSAHISSLFRYATLGARDINGDRVRLEIVKTPSGLKTSAEAIVRFIAALTDPDRPVPTPRTRQRQQAQDEAELVAAGMEIGGHGQQ